MKRTITLAFISLALLMVTDADAQNDAVTNAYFNQQQGKLDKAKAEIDRATTHEKTGNRAKTWYFRGSIYRGIAASEDPAVLALDTNALVTAYNSYKRAIELDGKSNEYAGNARKEMADLWGVAMNRGVKAFQAKNHEEALRYYRQAIAIQPEDTTAYLYSAYAYDALGSTEGVRRSYDQLFRLGRRTPDMYRTLANYSRAKDNDNKAALAHIQEGRKHFPNDKNLALDEASLLLAMGEGGRVRQKLEEAIKLDPANPSLYATLGSLYDQEAANEKTTPSQKEDARTKARAAYQKALELEPDNVDANFNMGVYHFNQGATLNKKVGAMNLNDYNKTGKKIEAQAKEQFTLALPYFEKAYAQQPTDKATRNSLRKTYEALGRTKDAQRIGE